MRQWLLAGVLLWLPANIDARAVPCDIRPNTQTPLGPCVRLIDQKELQYDRIDGVAFREISDAAYDPSRQLLYLLSDKGRLFRLHARFSDREAVLDSPGGVRLHRPGHDRLKHRNHDSEGLTLDERGRLWVSFERQPRIERINAHGTLVERAALPQGFPPASQLRGPNKQLEALTWHPRYGLITALERPPRGTRSTDQALYALSGRTWHFQTEPIPGTSITAIETMDDGNLLVLERAVDSRHFNVVITLKKVYLDREHNSTCPTVVLGQMRADRGWSFENFEGLARVAPHRYIMVSDGGKHFYQRTVLLYFEVIACDGSAAASKGHRTPQKRRQAARSPKKSSP
jgi:hypothetical protein